MLESETRHLIGRLASSQHVVYKSVWAREGFGVGLFVEMFG